MLFKADDSRRRHIPQQARHWRPHFLTILRAAAVFQGLTQIIADCDANGRNAPPAVAIRRHRRPRARALALISINARTPPGADEVNPQARAIRSKQHQLFSEKRIHMRLARQKQRFPTLADLPG